MRESDTPRMSLVRGVPLSNRYDSNVQRPAPQTTGSVTLTRGFRVSVSPRFEPRHSDPAEPRFVFSYRIRIRNESNLRAQLLSREWLITDANGQSHRVQGDGVVGHQPDLAPGQGFEYSSFCPLPTEWGTMEGSYTMQVINPDGSLGDQFQIEIGRFYLMA